MCYFSSEIIPSLIVFNMISFKVNLYDKIATENKLLNGGTF